MKKSIFFTILFSYLLHHTTSGIDRVLPSFSYVLKTQLPTGLPAHGGLRGYYKGKPLHLKDGWCVIPENQEVVTFSIIVSQDIGFKSQGNTVQYLHRTNSPCRWFDITLQVSSSDHNNPEKKHLTYFWRIVEKSPQETPGIIPFNSIILYMNPDFIDRIEERIEKNCDEEKPYGCALSRTTLMLPTIFFKNNISPKEWKDAISYSELAALDLKTIHLEEKYNVYNESVIISLSALNKAQ